MRTWAGHWLVWEGATGLLSSILSGPRSMAPEPPEEEPLYSLNDGIAMVQIAGIMMSVAPSWAVASGLATSTSRASLALRTAARDPAVRAIMLRVSSPGGTAAGTQELAAAVRQARLAKPVRAHASDLAASAAYWVASQADAFTASETAIVGSIGTIARIVDSSAAFEAAGLRVEVVRSGPAKGGPQPGETVGPADVARLQVLVDGITSVFVREVTSARTASKAEEISTGDVWLAPKALALGLIDSVSDEGAAFAALSQSARSPFMSIWKSLFAGRSKAELADAQAAANAALAEVSPEGDRVKELEAELARVQSRAAVVEEAKTLGALSGSVGELADDLEALAGLPPEVSERIKSRLRAAAEQLKASDNLRVELGRLDAGEDAGGDIAKTMLAQARDAKARGLSPLAAVQATLAARKEAYAEARTITPGMRDALRR